MGNKCSNSTNVIEPEVMEEKTGVSKLKLSPSLENFVETVIAKRMEVHHREIAMTHQRLEKLEKEATLR